MKFINICNFGKVYTYVLLWKLKSQYAKLVMFGEMRRVWQRKKC